MVKILTSAIATAALIASASLAFAANGEIAKNGDFSGGLNNWTLGSSGEGVTSQTSADYVSHAGGSGTTGTGIFAAFGAGDILSGSISQVLKTVAGATYTVTFDFGAFGSKGGNAQKLSYDASSQGASSSLATGFFSTSSRKLTNVLEDIFEQGGFSFIAQSDKTVLSFKGEGITSGADMLLDNVSVVGQITPVPGPEAGAGLGALAMGGLALYVKRRRKQDVAAV